MQVGGHMVTFERGAIQFDELVADAPALGRASCTSRQSASHHELVVGRPPARKGTGLGDRLQIPCRAAAAGRARKQPAHHSLSGTHRRTCEVVFCGDEEVAGGGVRNSGMSAALRPLARATRVALGSPKGSNAGATWTPGQLMGRRTAHSAGAGYCACPARTVILQVNTRRSIA